jgi:hypothetical protein
VGRHLQTYLPLFRQVGTVDRIEDWCGEQSVVEVS